MNTNSEIDPWLSIRLNKSPSENNYFKYFAEFKLSCQNPNADETLIAKIKQHRIKLVLLISDLKKLLNDMKHREKRFITQSGEKGKRNSKHGYKSFYQVDIHEKSHTLSFINLVILIFTFCYK